LIGFLLALAVVFAFVFGMGFGLKLDMKKVMREAGFSKDSAKLYGRAAKLLVRLEQVTDLDGAYSGDVLSDETQRLVKEWLADYRKQIKKV
jgi:hypothetical protein